LTNATAIELLDLVDPMEDYVFVSNMEKMAMTFVDAKNFSTV
jgi:hypothetical protein